VFTGNKHSLRVKNREYICDVVTGAANSFTVNSLAVNPGLENVFPFLSQLAANYEQYKIHGLVFYYRSLAGNALNSTNAALGSVILGCVYDSDASVFSSKYEMENYEFATSGRPSQDLLYPLECSAKYSPQSVLFVRSGSLNPSTLDKKQYDFALFQYATAGNQQASMNCGELWISYDIELFKPRLFGSLGFDAQVFMSYNGTGITNAAPLGTSTAWTHLATPAVGINSLGAIVTSGTTITLPAGIIPGTVYTIEITWYGGAAGFNGGATPFTVSSALEILNINLGVTGGLDDPYAYGYTGTLVNQTGAVLNSIFRVKKDVGPPSSVSTLTITNTTMFAATAYCQVNIFQIGKVYNY